MLLRWSRLPALLQETLAASVSRLYQPPAVENRRSHGTAERVRLRSSRLTPLPQNSGRAAAAIVAAHAAPTEQRKGCGCDRRGSRRSHREGLAAVYAGTKNSTARVCSLPFKGRVGVGMGFRIDRSRAAGLESRQVLNTPSFARRYTAPDRQAVFCARCFRAFACGGRALPVAGCPQPYNTRKGKTVGGPSTVFKHPAAPSEQGGVFEHFARNIQ